jgi:monoamine oxidase
VVNDSRGYVAELLAKAVSKNALEQEITPADKEKVLAMLTSFGNLDKDHFYKGSTRAGYSTPPGAGATAGSRYDPIDLSELLKSSFWTYKMQFAEGYNQAATMLEPVGGMDQIAKAFEQQVGSMIQYQAEVKQLRKTEQGVQAIYQDATGTEQAVDANFAICTLPLTVLAGLDADFSPAYKAAIAEGAKTYVNAVKVGFQADRRFWEEDDHIYGGISWTEGDITQIWYPSTGFHRAKGIIVSAYIWDNEISNRWQELPPAQRIAQAIADGSKLHPNYAQEVKPSQGVTTAWGKIPYSMGGWMEWEDEIRETVYPVLNQPDGPIYLAGEHLSYITGWQEGAVVSAHQTVSAISAKLQAMKG